eukprot:TRINITY_DN24472_c0_g1_i2.p1 TRINITY_DN24472_c0_g1~~TRINITY_DN24472_c0_g1_i2.p1  ORF type:complete len:712 (-),score=185.03 TRINITY_DN24472_c0_g1_i2:31-2166(-)
MSSDLARLENASALRTWEADRSKAFSSWRESVRTLLSGLKSTIDLGVAHHTQLDRFLRVRSAAERAYSKALLDALKPAVLMPTVTEPHQGGGSGASAAKGSARPQQQQPALAMTSGGSSSSSSKNPARAAHADPAADIAGCVTAATAALFAATKSPLLASISDLQQAVSAAREAFAAELLEGSMLAGLTQNMEEYQKSGRGMLEALERGLADVAEASGKAGEAMVDFQRASIQGRHGLTAALSGEPPFDMWLVEHRWRRAVSCLQAKQRDFIVQLCGAVQDLWRLEEWREDMWRKALTRFCTMLHKVETTVQCYANDGIKALAGFKSSDPSERCVLEALEKVLQAAPAGDSSKPVARGQLPAQLSQWPAMRRIRQLGRTGAPPSTQLVRTGGPLQAPGRWYGWNSCVVVLTKDDWLHCFHISESKTGLQGSRPHPSASSTAPPVKANHGPPAAPPHPGTSSGPSGTSGAPPAAPHSAVAAVGDQEDADSSCETDAPEPPDGGMMAIEATPQWSMYVPHTKVELTSGRGKSFDLEEVRKPWFFGLAGSGRRESLQATNEESARRWVDTIGEFQAGNDSQAALLNTEAAASSGKKSPPPPPADAPKRELHEAGVLNGHKAPSTAPGDGAASSSSCTLPLTASTDGRQVLTAAGAAGAAAGAAPADDTKARPPPPPPPPPQCAEGEAARSSQQLLQVEEATDLSGCLSAEECFG